MVLSVNHMYEISIKTMFVQTMNDNYRYSVAISDFLSWLNSVVLTDLVKYEI